MPIPWVPLAAGASIASSLTNIGSTLLGGRDSDNRGQLGSLGAGISDEEYRRRFFNQFPDPYGVNGAMTGGVPPPSSVRRDPQFLRLYHGGQLLPVEDAPTTEEFGGGEAAAGGHDTARNSLLQSIESISNLPIAQERPDLPDELRDRALQTQGLSDEMIQQVRANINNLRTGDVYQTSDAQRQRLIDRAGAGFGQNLQKQIDDSMGLMNQMGILPGKRVGGSSAFEDRISDMSLRYYGDPLNDFTTDLDIQIEADRVARQRQNRDNATQLERDLNQFAGNRDEFAKRYNLDYLNTSLNDINSRRNFLGNTLGTFSGAGQAAGNLGLGYEQLGFQEGQWADQLGLTQQQMAMNQQQADAAGDNKLWNLAGQLGPAIINKIPWGDIFGKGGPSQGGGGDFPPPKAISSFGPTAPVSQLLSSSPNRYGGFVNPTFPRAFG